MFVLLRGDRGTLLVRDFLKEASMTRFIRYQLL